MICEAYFYGAFDAFLSTLPLKMFFNIKLGLESTKYIILFHSYIPNLFLVGRSLLTTKCSLPSVFQCTNLCAVYRINSVLLTICDFEGQSEHLPVNNLPFTFLFLLCV